MRKSFGLSLYSRPVTGKFIRMDTTLFLYVKGGIDPAIRPGTGKPSCCRSPLTPAPRYFAAVRAAKTQRHRALHLPALERPHASRRAGNARPKPAELQPAAPVRWRISPRRAPY